MTTEQENKIIEQAQDIMARRFAVENELKLNAQSVAYYGAYYLGAIQAVQKVVSELMKAKAKELGIDLKERYDYGEKCNQD